MSRIIFLRKPKSAKGDIDELIQDVSSISNVGFAILKSSSHETVYIATSLSRRKFSDMWRTCNSSTDFSRPRFCSPLMSFLDITRDTEYMGSKLVYSTSPKSTKSSVQNTPPPICRVSVPESTPPLCEKRSSDKIRKIAHPKKLLLDDITCEPAQVIAHIPPPFYLLGYTTVLSSGQWRAHHTEFFAEVALPEEIAYSDYLMWVDTMAPKFKCRLFQDYEEFHEMYYNVCDHLDCHPQVEMPCPGCLCDSCRCTEIVLDNSWMAQYRRAKQCGDLIEAERCKDTYLAGVPNPPSVSFSERSRMMREVRYQTRLSKFTEEEKIQKCSDFMERLFRVPGAEKCTTLLELRRTAWSHLRHSSFFLKHYNSYIPEIAKILV
jgi:hypothetical protein